MLAIAIHGNPLAHPLHTLVENARQVVQALFALDLEAGLFPMEWTTVVRGFQKRHVLAHKMGVVDEEYVRRTSDGSVFVGRKMPVAVDEVRKLAALLAKVARNLSEGLRGQK